MICNYECQLQERFSFERKKVWDIDGENVLLNVTGFHRANGDCTETIPLLKLTRITERLMNYKLNYHAKFPLLLREGQVPL